MSYGSDDTYAVVPVKADPVMQSELRLRAAAFWQYVKNPGALVTLDATPWKAPPQTVKLDLSLADSAVIEQETEFAGRARLGRSGRTERSRRAPLRPSKRS